MDGEHLDCSDPIDITPCESALLPSSLLPSSTPSTRDLPTGSSADSQDDALVNVSLTTETVIALGIGVILFIILILIVLLVVCISVLLWLRKRKREPKLVDNVAYLSQNIELESNHTVSAANVVMESYGANSVPTSPNIAYQTVQPPSMKSVDIATSVNEAYATTDITTSVNAAYQPSSQQLEYDYVRSDNDLEHDVD